ncbi:MAG: glutathionylspermidine synthase family protein [Bacteroidota bacterium]
MVDNRLIPVEGFKLYELKELGLQWFWGDGTWDYFAEEVVQITPTECDAFHDAADQLYEMYKKAGTVVVEEGRWTELGIPRRFQDLMEYSWGNTSHLPLFGRFDFAGGIDGAPIKLLEYNSDTCSILPESAIAQWEILRKNGLENHDQFNDLFEDLVDRFKQVLLANPDLPPYILLSSMGFEEDAVNVKLLADAAREAGFEVVSEYPLKDVIFSPEDGIFVEVSPGEFQPFGFWYKLVPWDFLAFEEPELMDILADIIMDRRVMVLNPPFTMMYQSKGMLKILWELFPDHPLLLPATSDANHQWNTPFVQKPYFGREGENVKIFDQHRYLLAEHDGDYGEQRMVYQAMATLNRDSEKNYYQPGVYFCKEPCALSFRRRDGMIIDEDSQFIGHLIKE